MPYGLPSSIFLSRSEWTLEYHSGDPVQITAKISATKKVEPEDDFV